MIQSKPVPQVTVVEITDPAAVARHRQQDERHRRNLQWLQAHWKDLPEPRGRYVAVADEQAFVAETAEVAWDWARSEHPADDGAVVMFVPRERGWRIYANNFDVIVSRPKSEVVLLAPRHRYELVPG